MTTFNQSMIRIRRFLRDPTGLIWSDDQIQMLWNEAQLEVADKIKYIERVHSYKYPPEWTWSYLYDWETHHIDGDKHQSLELWPVRNAAICYPWEAGYFLDSMSTVDEDYRFTHPWEAVYGTPADVVKIPLHMKFHQARFVAFGESKIEPSTEREIALNDPYYKTVDGEALNYYRPDDYENTMVIYPRPSSVTWDDVSLMREPLTDSFSDTLAEGIITGIDDTFKESDYGIITDTIATDGNLFMIFDSLPDDIEDSEGDWDEELAWWPPYMIPVVEYAVLERCFGSDTDGFIPSLRDYWKIKKEIGIAGIKLFKSLRAYDRDYQLGGTLKDRRRRGPRLPEHYPLQYP